MCPLGKHSVCRVTSTLCPGLLQRSVIVLNYSKKNQTSDMNRQAIQLDPLMIIAQIRESGMIFKLTVITWPSAGYNIFQSLQFHDSGALA